jgi:hypothetical protein
MYGFFNRYTLAADHKDIDRIHMRHSVLEYITTENVVSFLPKLHQKYIFNNDVSDIDTLFRNATFIGYLIKNNINGCLSFNDFASKPKYGVLLATMLNNTAYVRDNISKVFIDEEPKYCYSYVDNMTYYACCSAELIKILSNTKYVPNKQLLKFQAMRCNNLPVLKYILNKHFKSGTHIPLSHNASKEILEYLLFDKTAPNIKNKTSIQSLFDTITNN